jgi:hypothetical protein
VTKVAAGFKLVPLAEAAPIIDFTGVVFVKLLICLEFSPRPSNQPEKAHEKLDHTTPVTPPKRVDTGKRVDVLRNKLRNTQAGSPCIQGLPADLGEIKAFFDR